PTRRRSRSSARSARSRALRTPRTLRAPPPRDPPAAGRPRPRVRRIRGGRGLHHGPVAGSTAAPLLRSFQRSKARPNIVLVPELPEVEITARRIGAAVSGATVEPALA